MPKKSRPPFVKHIIALMLIFGVFFIGLNAFVATGLLVNYPSLLTMAIFMLYGGLLAAIFVCAYGLWTMQRWARKATIAMLIAVIISGLPGFFAVLIFYRAIRNLLKTETKAAFGEKLDEYEVEEQKFKARKAKKICEECGAKDVLLHELEKGKKIKLVCYECLKKATESSTKGMEE